MSPPCNNRCGKNPFKPAPQQQIASSKGLGYASWMTDTRESGLTLDPKYDADGLLTAVVVDAADGAVLMVGHMNGEALQNTRESGKVTFFSRSRQRLWTKGESSGNFLQLVELRVDCDQDALLVIARPEGPTCHTGERSCFYRRIGPEGLERL